MGYPAWPGSAARRSGTSSTFQEVAVKAVVDEGRFKVAVEDVPDASHPANA